MKEVRSSICGRDQQVAVESQQLREHGMCSAHVLTTSLKPSLLCSLKEPTRALPELGASFQQPTCALALCGELLFLEGGLSKKQVAVSRKMSLLTRLECTELEVGL